MLLLQRTFNGVKLTLLGAERTTNAQVRIDVSLLTDFQISLKRTGRAGVGSGHAAHTLLIINLRHAIDHFNRTKVAGLHAGFAANAGTVALFLKRHALFRVMAAHGNNAVIRLHAQHMLRASRHALLTALALLLVNDGDLLHRIDGNRTKRAGTLTSAEAKTSILTSLGTAVHQ